MNVNELRIGNSVKINNDLLPETEMLEKQSDIVQQRLNYHFKTTDGSWNTVKTLPFMKEFLNEVQLLCDLSKKGTEKSE